MKKLIVCAAASLLLVSTVNAQIGIGKIKGKIKEATKKEEKSTNSGNSSSNTSSSTNSTTNSSTGNTTNTPKKDAGPKLYETDGITSEMHKKYMNQVVFASSFSNIQKGQEIESSFLKSYKLGDPLYYRAYTDNSIANYAILNGRNTFHLRWKFKVYLDGEQIGIVNTVKQASGEEKEKWTTFKSALIVDNLKEFQDGATTENMVSFITENFNKFTVGKHKLKFELFPESETSSPSDMPVVSVGELELDVPAKLPLNTSLCLLEKAAVSNPKLEAELMKAANKDGAKNGVKITKVLLMDKDWEDIRGQSTGMILRKEIHAINIGTEENGTKCFYQPVLYAKNLYPAKGEDPNYIKEYGSGESLICTCIK